MTYGFIGLGNMAGAIIGGMRRSEKYRDARIVGCDTFADKRDRMAEQWGVETFTEDTRVMELADMVFFAIKPQVLGHIMPKLAGAVREGQLIVSIAAGREIAYYEEHLPAGTPFVRVMPNINALVGAAASAVCGGTHATEAQVTAVEDVLSTTGRVFRLGENLFSAFTALSGSSVAFAYMYIDAIARAGVKAGFPKQLALEISAAAALGSAEMVTKSGHAPMELVDMVCSPGGTTIEGVLSLQEDGFEAAIHRAVAAVIRRDKELKN